MQADPIRRPASLPRRVLLDELDRRATAHRDQPLGTSDQICPNCSTTDKEVFGLWHRSTSRFHCEACKVRLQGNGYEFRFEDRVRFKAIAQIFDNDGVRMLQHLSDSKKSLSVWVDQTLKDHSSIPAQIAPNYFFIRVEEIGPHCDVEDESDKASAEFVFEGIPGAVFQSLPSAFTFADFLVFAKTKA